MKQIMVNFEHTKKLACIIKIKRSESEFWTYWVSSAAKLQRGILGQKSFSNTCQDLRGFDIYWSRSYWSGHYRTVKSLLWHHHSSILLQIYHINLTSLISDEQAQFLCSNIIVDKLEHVIKYLVLNHKFQISFSNMYIISVY